ncbi:MAG: hypothetical protein H0T18_04535 [Chloroflexia bacterium]|nr:hypothetical protein [Chloroflexia bacterium]
MNFHNQIRFEQRPDHRRVILGNSARQCTTVSLDKFAERRRDICGGLSLGVDYLRDTRSGHPVEIATDRLLLDAGTGGVILSIEQTIAQIDKW